MLAKRACAALAAGWAALHAMALHVAATPLDDYLEAPEAVYKWEDTGHKVQYVMTSQSSLCNMHVPASAVRGAELAWRACSVLPALLFCSCVHTVNVCLLLETNTRMAFL